jgi:cellulose synthase/poly-beta-1,6-N-acetylglucosamine synthase-like glycosyltransferase
MQLKRKKISVFIPVYESSNLLEELLEDLTSESYEDKEIFVTIDKPNEQSLETAQKYADKVTFTLNEQRRGKVDSLNSVVEISGGEILVFLDSDIKSGSDEFLAVIEREINGVDLLDFKKEVVRDAFIPRMVNYEYVSSNLGNYLFSKMIKKCFAINGAAFAIKRDAFEEVGGFSKVISEDLDIAVKTLLKNCTFKFTDNVGVSTKAPSNWRSWFTQRKRWGIGTGLWIKNHWRNLGKSVAKYPHIAIPSLIILFPTLLPMVLNYAFSNALYYKIFTFVLLLLATQLSFLIPLLSSASMGMVLFTSLVNSFISFLLFSVLFYSASRKLKLHFNFLEFLIYYVFYQPLAFFTLIVGIITSFLSSKYKVDWKV